MAVTSVVQEGPGRIPCGQRFGRMAIAMMAVCFVLHLMLVVLEGPPGLAVTMPMLGLSSLCAARAWRGQDSEPGRRELASVAVAGLMMSVLHLAMQHQHAAMAAMAGQDDWSAVWLVQRGAIILGLGQVVFAIGSLSISSASARALKPRPRTCVHTR